MFDNNGGEIDARDVAVLLSGAIGATVENYIEQDYCDPSLYKLVEFAEELSVHLHFPELTENLAFLRVRAGEAVNEYIEKHDLPVNKEEWSK
jgi:hypothetical protein